MNCWDCQYFKISYEPIKDKTGIWDFGRAACSKHNLVVDFPSHRKLKKLVCIEDQVASYKQVTSKLKPTRAANRGRK